MGRTKAEDQDGAPRARRARGEGSVYQDKHGQWWAAVYQGGRQKRVRAVSRKEAQAKLRELKQQQSAGVNIGTGRVVVKEYLQGWIQLKDEAGLETTTLANYRYHCESHILPVIGGLRLDAVTTEHIEGVIGRMRRAGVASSTVAKVYDILKSVFKKATRERRIPFSPVEAVDRPRVTIAESLPITHSEWAAIAWAVEGHRFEALYHLTICLGLRKGEALGLRMTDVNLDAATLRLEQTVLQADNKVHIGGIKNDRPRTVPLTPRLVELLRARLTQLETERQHPRWQEHGLVFPCEDGQPQVQSNFHKHFARVKRVAGIGRKMRFHDLRHTTASWLADLGVSREIIGRLLGHSGEGITGRYIHVGADPVRVAVELLDRERVAVEFAPTEAQQTARWEFRYKGGRKAA